MNTLTFSISPSVQTAYPDICVGAFVASGLVSASTRLDVPGLLKEARQVLTEGGVTIANLADEPRIQGWRQAVQKSALKPSTFKASAEQLARRLINDSTIATPLPIVTVYCAVSAKHLAPLGAYDWSRLPSEQLELRHANPGGDSFTPLGGRSEDMPIKPGVVVYAIGQEIICWSFNYRDSRNTCLLKDTELGVIFGEAVTPEQRTALETALNELQTLLVRAGAVTSDIFYANATAPSFTLQQIS